MKSTDHRSQQDWICLKILKTFMKVGSKLRRVWGTSAIFPISGLTKQVGWLLWTRLEFDLYETDREEEAYYGFDEEAFEISRDDATWGTFWWEQTTKCSCPSASWYVLTFGAKDGDLQDRQVWIWICRLEIDVGDAISFRDGIVSQQMRNEKETRRIV